MRLVGIIMAALWAVSPAHSAEPQPIPPERMAAAERFLDSMNYDELVERTLETVMAESQRALEAKLTSDFGNAMSGSVVREISAIARRHVDKALKDNRSVLKRGTATIYASHFTTEELERLAAIQADPVMVKYLGELPQISAESLALSRAAMEKEQSSMAAEIRALIESYARGTSRGPST